MPREQLFWHFLPDDGKTQYKPRKKVVVGRTLHEFACWCATDALKTAKVEDERCWNAIRVKLRWLKGEATNKELASARAAARDAARDKQNRKLSAMLLKLEPTK